MDSPEIDVEEVMRDVQNPGQALDKEVIPPDVHGPTDPTQAAPLSSVFPSLHAAVGQVMNTPDTFAAARLALSQRRLGMLVSPFLKRLVNFFASWQVQWNMVVARALGQVLRSLEQRDQRMDGIEESIRGLQKHVETQAQNLEERLQETHIGQWELYQQARLLEVRWKTLEENQKQDRQERDEQLQTLQEHLQEADAVQGELRRQVGLLEVRWKTLQERQQQEEALREQLLTRLQQELQERQQQEAALQEQLLTRLQQELQERDERLIQEQGEREHLQQELEELLQRHTELFRNYQDLRQENLLQKRRLDLILAEMRQKATLNQQSAQTIMAEGERLLDHTYFLFENRFRGAQEEIRKRQEIYLPLFQATLPADAPFPQKDGFILDLGCGRGEMLEVLREAGITAKGVDINEDMVLVCRQKGLAVVREDLFVYLRSLADESLAGAISCQMIEHLTVEQNIELFRLLYDKLQWGARLVLETVNPENLLVSSCNFYIDLSHRLKIPAESLTFLAEALGFTVMETRYLSPFPPEHHFRLLDRRGADPHLQLMSENFQRLNSFFFGPQEYALICCKGRAEGN